MHPPRRLPILVYVLSLAVAVALLVTWVVYVVNSGSRLAELGSRLGVTTWDVPWVVLVVGCALLFLLIGGLTWQLAQALAATRYLRAQDEFLANVTHELKSPLAAIKLHAQTLEQDDVSPEERQVFMGYILREAERTSALVDNLLESSRLIAGKSTGDLQPIDLREFFRDYQQTVRSRFDLGEIELRFEIRSQAVVMATSEALQRIMDNLISNALRFTEAGGQILCQVRDSLGGAEIVVADTGIGIPHGELPKIFDRFYRLRREIGQRGKGTGLGLAIVRGLVEELRGRIRAISSEGEPGTRFEIRLPQVDVPEESVERR